MLDPQHLGGTDWGEITLALSALCSNHIVSNFLDVLSGALTRHADAEARGAPVSHASQTAPHPDGSLDVRSHSCTVQLRALGTMLFALSAVASNVRHSSLQSAAVVEWEVSLNARNLPAISHTCSDTCQRCRVQVFTCSLALQSTTRHTLRSATHDQICASCLLLHPRTSSRNMPVGPIVAC